MARSPRRGLRYVYWAFAVLLLATVVGVRTFLHGSLPQLDGERAVSGLQSKVVATRDALGVPTITGDRRSDVAYATGFLHAQDRFFQMDLLRRAAAGELAELIGPAALPLDRERRIHQFRMRAEAALARESAADRALLDRYVAGVNDGIAALDTRPFEYALLGQRPAPWHPADTLLVVWAMYFDLQSEIGHKLTRGWLQQNATPEQLTFLLPDSSRWDAPLDAPSIDTPDAKLPEKAPDWFGRPTQALQDIKLADANVGSNNWALAGTRSEHGAAIVANDMHLGLRLPHIWYRAVMQYRGNDGRTRRLVGVTLPGSPCLIAGSNGHVAWGFTNSYGDYTDLIELQRDPHDATRYQTAQGWENITRVDERIAIKGGKFEMLPVYQTRFGPVREVGKKAFAIRWIAHEPGAVNLGLFRMEDANDLAALQAAANGAGIPSQNLVSGDTAGHIGWTIAGPLPNRRWQAAASFPYSSTDTRLNWQGLRAPADYPRIVDPERGQLWTANARQLAGDQYALIGDGGADLGARAQQVRDDLFRLGRSDEHGVYGVSLDDRALFAKQWRDRALAALDDASVAGKPQRAEYRHLLRDTWDGHAATQSVAYRLARGYMSSLYKQVFGGLDEAMSKELGGEYSYTRANSRWEFVLGRLDDAKPAGWLPKGHATWHEVELAAVDDIIEQLTKDGQPLAAATWGKRNTADITHPFVRFLPMLKPWLSAPADALPGDNNMPRVAGTDFGQSERMVVAPGHEELGIFNMPGGESGHPLSPYFLAGHSAWVKGEALPLLPGPAQHTLVFFPKN